MQSFTAFQRDRRIAQGPREAIVAALLAHGAEPTASDILVFDDASGRQVDFDLRAEPDAAARGRGRPSLGVVPREVTLLPRHWDWLATQPGGASGALRRLVDAARKRDGGERAAREAAFWFLNTMAGNRPHYEDAIRALFAGDREKLERLMEGWPRDIRVHALSLAAGQ